MSVIFSFTIVELFDILGTLIGLCKQGGLLDEKGNVKNLDRALQADSVGTIASAVFDGSAKSAYIENATGTGEGGKSGLTALTVAGCFFLSLIFAPLVTTIPNVATAPVLVLVGTMMLTEVKNINFDDYTDLIPVFLTIVMTSLTFNIGDGLAFGVLSYGFLKVTRPVI